MSFDLIDRAQRLAGAGRWAEVASLLEPVIEPMQSAPLWSMLGVARLRTGRRSAAADALLKAAELDGEGGRAWLNAAAILDQEGRMAEASAAVRRAMDAGFAPPEAHFLLGRSMQGAGDFDAAEDAFRAAIASRLTFAEAHRELAQMVWMRSGDREAAMEALDLAIASFPTDAKLLAERTRVLTAMGDDGATAAAARVVETMPAGGARRLFEAHAANLSGDYDRAASAARDAAAMGAEPERVLEAMATAQLGQGDAAGLLATAADWLRLARFNQLAIAYRATALRMLGAPEGDAFRDYETLVRAFDIDVPEGWPSLQAYLADLALALTPMHAFKAPPLGQSARHGSQTMQSLVDSMDRSVRAFFEAVDRPIRGYMTELGTGDDPLRARNSGAYAIRGCWSVRLEPGGFHVDHVHPQGWISSACYLETPDAVADQERKEGWIRFGQPPVQPPGGLLAEHFVQPRPGRLVLFPAWMWHGTVPFTSEERRLTVAFDVLPA